MRATRLLPLVLMTMPPGCASSPSPPPHPPALAPGTGGGTIVPPPPTTVVTRDSEGATPGAWSYRQDERVSIALFGTPGGDAVFTLRCEVRARRVFVSIVGTVPGALTLRAMTVQKIFAAAPTGGVSSYSASEINPLDAILDALAYSRGHFDVAFGPTHLAIPASPEFARVVEDCRG